MSLTGIPLLILVAAATVLIPVLAVITWRKPRRGMGWLSTVGRLIVIVVCQLLAISSTFLLVNTHFGFYTSWSDLAGRSGAPGTIHTSSRASSSPSPHHTNRPVSHGSGSVQTITVAGGPGTNGSHQVLVWLPPQYRASAAKHTQFPVMMVLPGQPSTPAAMFNHYRFGQTASAAVDSGHVAPFIAVFPPLMTTPPRDTECTNVPGGPQAESWLSRDVYQGIRHALRVNGRPWSILGWSTGGFCAAKLLLHHPGQYQAAASMGGYYETLTDKTTGNLFHGSSKIRNQNSPTWLYQHGGLHHRRLLLVVGRQDRESFSPTTKFLTISQGDPGVDSLTFQTGGHNYHNYRQQLPIILGWLPGT